MHEKTAFIFGGPEHNDRAGSVGENCKNFRARQKRAGGDKKEMEKTRRICPRAALCLLLALTLLAAPALAEGARQLVAVGRTVGIGAGTEGLLVVSLSEVETAEGKRSPAAECGIQPGDIIVRLGGCEVGTSAEFAQAAAGLDGSPVAVQLLRGEQLIQYTLTPALSAEENCWRLGLWLRDGIAGIGTVTFYDPETGLFGALGHSINDADTGVLLPLGEGYITPATVSDVLRGEKGRAGELHGAFDENSRLGSLERNTPEGIFGTVTGGFEGTPLPAAEDAEIENGPATILANVAGSEVREYAVEISRAQSGGRLLVTVTDPALLEATGGIVQGMSGSPIIQNGKLVGAVTHVLISDPTRGYGITISSMLRAAEAAQTMAIAA